MSQHTFNPGDTVKHEHIGTELMVVVHDAHDPNLVTCEVGGQRIAVPSKNLTLVRAANPDAGRKLLT